MADKKKLLEAVKLFGNGETAKASELLKECIRETAVQLMKEAVEEEKKPTDDEAATLIGEIQAEEPSEDELDLDAEGAEEEEQAEVVTTDDAVEAVEDAAETAAVSEEELAALEAEFEKKLADAAIKMDAEEVEAAKAEAAEEEVEGEVTEEPVDDQEVVDVEEFVK